jgi:2'-5' RNA ligase
MEKTTPYKELSKNVVGYMLNSPLDIESQQAVHILQSRLKDLFGETIWIVPVESLHITLMDWIAPLVDYGQDKDEIFQEIFAEYESTLEGILKEISEIPVTFSDIHVSSGGVYLTGTDQGQFATIRDRFLEHVDLIAGTKQPPSIIHVTIARFMKAVDLKPIQDTIAQESMTFSQPISSFVLVRETKIPMLEREIIKTYTLAG